MHLKSLLKLLSLCWLLFLPSLTHAFCWVKHPTTHPVKHCCPTPNYIFTNNYHPAPFNKISTSGLMKVEINAQCSNYSVQLVGTHQTLIATSMSVQNGTLHVSTPLQYNNNYNYPLTVRINLPQLCDLDTVCATRVTANHLCGPISVAVGGASNVTLCGQNIDLRTLEVSGPTNVTINDLCSRCLNVRIRGSGIICLHGMAVLQALNYSGSGAVSLYWVNSNHVRVCASGGGHIALAGVADRIDATLNQHVYLDAKQLHAQRGYIHTQDFSRADVWVRDSLSAWATGFSGIYYYRAPRFVGPYMFPPAVVLNMSTVPYVPRHSSCDDCG